MKITYAPNPIWSSVALDDSDIEKLRAGIVADWTEDGVVPTDEFVRQRIEHCVDVLNSAHMGDCTCCPFTCEKCVAEGHLGIDTMPGLYKHDAYKVDAAFGNGRNIHEAIAWLADYGERLDATPDDEKYTGTAQHIAIWDSATPRWKLEGKRAHEWLVQYRDEHFPLREVVAQSKTRANKLDAY